MAARKISVLPDKDTIPVSILKLNPTNPRNIEADELESLKQSINGFKKMMEIRPIVVDETLMCLGGNQRLTAIKKLKMKTIPRDWILQRTDLTPEEKQEFIIKDNGDWGGWDIAALTSNYDGFPIEKWGVKIEDLTPKKEKEVKFKASQKPTLKFTFESEEDKAFAETKLSELDPENSTKALLIALR